MICSIRKIENGKEKSKKSWLYYRTKPSTSLRGTPKQTYLESLIKTQ
jgi:hypothetical protein